MSAQSKLFLGIAFALFVGTTIMGIVIGYSGKPYSVVLLAIHKLTGIGAALFAVLFVIGLLKNVSAQTLAVLFMILAATSFLALLATGGLMSAGKTNALFRIIHIAATLLLLLSGGGAIATLIERLKGNL